MTRKKSLYSSDDPLVEAATDSEALAASGVVGKTFKAALALGARQVLVQGANVLGGILLARLLSPQDFGLFGIIVFLLGFLLVFGGTGLAANLIRQQEDPTEADYRAVFALQQMVVLSLVSLFWLVSPWIVAAYGLPMTDVWVFRLVALSLFVTSFMVIPQVRLERSLDFHKLAAVEVAQAVVFNAAAVFLAWKGTGGMGLALALLLRAITGAVAVNLVNPWPIRWGWDWRRARRHLRFGLHFQSSQLISTLKDSITPVFVGLLLGVAAAGYLNWAVMVAAYPVLALMILQRLYMPAFARMQAHPEQLGRFVEKVIWATNALTAPLAILTLVLIEPITRLVFGEKWLVALPLFYLLWAANLLVPTAAPLMGLLNALGAARTTLAFTILWMTGTWVLGVPLILAYGSIGFAVANFAITLSAFLLFRVARSRVRFRILRVVVPTWFVAGVTGFGLALVATAWPVETLPALIAYSLAALLSYGGLMLAMNRKILSALREAMDDALGSLAVSHREDRNNAE